MSGAKEARARRHKLIGWALGALFLPTSALAQSLLEPLPDSSAPAAAPAPVQSAPPADPASGQRLSQLFYQLQVLQQEVQELRGLVEEQAYQIERLARDQQEQYIDLDRRIAEFTTGGAPRVAAGAGRTTPGAPAAAGAAAAADAGRTLPSQPLALAGGSPESEREAYTRAFELMKARQFDESAAAFNRLIGDYPNGQYTPNAFYWLGELYLAQTQTEQARQSFSQVLNLYPDHPKVPDTLYKMGVVYHRLGDNSRAIAYFQQVQTEHPDSSAAGLATRYMAELQ